MVQAPYASSVGQPLDEWAGVNEVTLNWSVLVVDDEPMARTLLRLMLVRAGFDVFEAEDGFDALDKVKIRTPDVMILDVMMPGMDGFAVCEVLRDDEITSTMPIIMLSAKTDLDSVNRGLRAGATKYLTKPVSPEDLTRNVRDVLENGRYGHGEEEVKEEKK